MTSLESIGSCSLDVDTTASESSADVGDGLGSSVSQRTLYSVSAEIPNGSYSASHRSCLGVHQSNKISTARHHNTQPTTYVSEMNISNGKGTDSVEESNSDDQRKKPSYVNISCSVSGYTSYSCYNSKAREGFRSRDNSPGRLAFHNNDTENANGVNGSNKRWSGVDVTDRTASYETLDSVNLPTNVSTSSVFQHISSSTTTRKTTVVTFSNGSVETSVNEQIVINDERDNLEENSFCTEPKSLIQQRIERLYGPGYLAHGFLCHKDRKQGTGFRSNSSSPEQNKLSPFTSYFSPSSTRSNQPVFRHLRKQLNEDSSTSSAISHIEPSASYSKDNEEQKIEVGVEYSNHLKNTTVDETTAQESSDKRNSISNGYLNNTSLHNGKHEKAEEKSQEISNDSCKDGHTFIKILEDEKDKIEALIELAVNDLQLKTLTEDVCGRLRAAIGKAKLLLSQKFQQFRGLCEKNINQTADDPFPTTVSDLEGFWDMVLIQVEDIYLIFEEINKMRQNGWHVSLPSEDLTSKPSRVSSKHKPSSVKNSSAAPVAPRSAKAEEAAKAREEARKKLMQSKRKAFKQQQVSDFQDGSSIEIFLPENKE